MLIPLFINSSGQMLSVTIEGLWVGPSILLFYKKMVLKFINDQFLTGSRRNVSCIKVQKGVHHEHPF